MFKLFRSRIFQQQFSYFFIIIIITFSAISGVIFQITKHSEEKQKLEIAKSYRTEASITINRWIQGREDFIRIQTDFLSRMKKEELSSKTATEIIKRQLAWNSNFHNIAIIDERGYIVNSKDGELAGVNVSDRKYFQNAIKGKSYIEGILRSRVDNVPVIVVACPFEIGEKDNYILIGTISLEKISQIVESLKLDNLGSAFLVDSEGLRITDNEYISDIIQNGDLIDKSKYRVNSLAGNKLIERQSGTEIYINTNGNKVYGSFEWLSTLDIGLAVQLEDKVVMKPINDLTRLISTLGIIVAIVGFILAYLISRKMVEPIYMLVNSAENITSYNYNEAIAINTNTELDVLVNQFNRMQQAIISREVQLIKKNEELKIQRAEAIQANILKSQFLANMSHELRTPLNSIIGFTNRVIKKSGETLEDTQKENLEIVKEEAQHLLELINDLLDYSKIEAGKMEVYRESFDLGEVIKEVYNMMQSLVDSTGVHYAQHLFGKKIPMMSDRMKVKQIMINLLSNAFKYSEKGTITLSVDNIDNQYVIEVKDQGVGIAEEHIQSIFDEFRQIDGSYTRKVGGTGLGLSITKRFVEMLGGSISVESIVGKGSKFTVILPHFIEVIETMEKPIKKRMSHIKPLIPKVKKIVCIDDDQHVQRLYKEYLSEQEYEVISLKGSEDILDEIKRINPEAIILDIMLPEKDGWEILSELKTNNDTRTIPVIMASVLSESNLAFKLNADEYLIKPVLQDEFIDTIKRTIKRKERINIIVADDDENYLTLISQLLHEQAIDYRLARDGNEVIEQINIRVPDLLLLDMMMPEKDGFTILESIKAMPKCNNMVIVVVTAKDLTLIEKALLKKRTKAVIQKSGTHVDSVMNILVKWIGEKLDEK